MSTVSEPTNGSRQESPLMPSREPQLLSTNQVSLRCVHWFVGEADEDRCDQGTCGYRQVKVCPGDVFNGELSRPLTSVLFLAVIFLHYS